MASCRIDRHAATVEPVRDELRARGLRWTPQRRLILDVLEATNGHITGSELVERCRARDPDTTPSTVYRTLDVLEELGYIRHSHWRPVARSSTCCRRPTTATSSAGPASRPGSSARTSRPRSSGRSSAGSRSSPTSAT